MNEILNQRHVDEELLKALSQEEPPPDQYEDPVSTPSTLANTSGDESSSDTEQESGLLESEKEARVRIWKAMDLDPARPVEWIATGRIPRAGVTVLVGDEGIGKSLFWVMIVAAVTTGRGLPGFGIPPGPPLKVLLTVTEDDWASVVKPRLEVAGADLENIEVTCAESDGTGTPEFPGDMHLISHSWTHYDLIVVDAWVETLPRILNIQRPQEARRALHPWKQLASQLNCAVLLLTHTNRVGTDNARDKYGLTGELRKSARLTLWAQKDEKGVLTVGPEKSNLTSQTLATEFAITTVQKFAPTTAPDGTIQNDGTVPRLDVVGQSKRTANDILGDVVSAGQNDIGGNECERFLIDFIIDSGGEVAAKEATRHMVENGFNRVEINHARERARHPRIKTGRKGFGKGSYFVWSVDSSDSDDGTTSDVDDDCPHTSHIVPIDPTYPMQGNYGNYGNYGDPLTDEPSHCGKCGGPLDEISREEGSTTCTDCVMDATYEQSGIPGLDGG